MPPATWARAVVALLGALIFLAAAAGIDVERRKPDGSTALALAFALMGAAVFLVGILG